MKSVPTHPPRDREGGMESLWVRIKGRAVTRGDITVRVCHKPPDQEGQMDKAIYKQRAAASHSQALVFMGAFSHPGISWRDNTAGHLQTRKCLVFGCHGLIIFFLQDRDILSWTLMSPQWGAVVEHEVQWWNGGMQDPQGCEESTQQAHHPGLQESRLWSLQIFCSRECHGTKPRRTEGPKKSG